MINSTRKGITPVIAIVLLLLITVGAVGTVYTQFQGLLQDPDTEFLESVDVNLQSANRETGTSGLDIVDSDGNTRSAPDTISIRFENTMDREFVLNQSLRMEYSVPGESRSEPTFVSGSNVTQLFGEYDVMDLSNTTQFDQCLGDVSEESGEEYLFSPGETIQCNTGFEMPQPSDEVTVHLVEVGSGEVADEYTCSPSTSSSTTC
jgi:flagellin-like protein